jgi:DNA primase
VAVVPAPHDPDSFIKANGGAAMQKLVAGAEGFFDYYLARLCSTNDLGGDKGRLAVLRAMAEAVRKTGNVVLIDTYAQKTALRLGVSAESVRAEFKKTPAQAMAPRADDEESFESAEAAEEVARPAPAEFHLLKLLLLHDDLVPWAARHLEANWISHARVREIVDQRLVAQEHETWHSLAEFLDACESPEACSLITEAVTADRKIPNPETQLADVTLKLRNQHLERQIGALTQKISHPETNDDERVALLREQMKLKEQKRAPLAPLRHG